MVFKLYRWFTFPVSLPGKTIECIYYKLFITKMKSRTQAQDTSGHVFKTFLETYWVEQMVIKWFAPRSQNVFSCRSLPFSVLFMESFLHLFCTLFINEFNLAVRRTRGAVLAQWPKFIRHHLVILLSSNNWGHDNWHSLFRIWLTNTINFKLGTV